MREIMSQWKIAVKAFIVHNGKLLSLKRRDNDPHQPSVWEIPGGRLETGENPYDGLKREVQEETGLHIEILSPLHVHHFKRDDGQYITMIVFYCTTDQMKVDLSEEHTEYAWSSISMAEKHLTPHFHEDLKRFRTFFKK